MSLENKLAQKNLGHLKNTFLSVLTALSMLSCGGDSPTKPPIKPPIKPPTTQEQNHAPIINSNAVREVNEVSPYRYDISASDSDGDVMNYFMIEGPDWLSVTSNTIHGNAPEVFEDKIFPVKVRVSDAKRGDADQSFNLTVKNVYNVHTLTESQLNQLSRIDNSSVTFSGPTNFFQGDVIVGGISNKTPYGILRKVKSVSGNVAYTERATLEDAIRDGSFSFRQNLSSQGARLSKVAPAGVSEISMPGFEFSYNMDDIVLRRETSGILIVNGNVSFNITPDIDSDFKKRSIKVKLLVDGRVDIELNSNLDLYISAFQESFPLIDLPPVPVLGTPFVVTPKMDIIIGVMPGLSASLETRVTHELDIEPGLLYENGSWKNISSVKNDFDFSVTKIMRKTDVEIYAGPFLKLHLNDYGLISPAIQGGISGNLRFKAESKNDWELWGGVAANVGVDPGRFFKIFIPLTIYR
ncbi:MAG: hypothetical protein KJ905_03720 [Nanoarchaeota archaeon]|nr:hypothetical protein [Nanoarchaeota archaeon]MBU1501849.1 hypothetical protein [Nanoarchaeota archaeon]MBU2459219.1 hypothetical protein [Nanoarchaeota archaeon]